MKKALAFTHMGTRYAVSLDKKNKGNVIKYGENNFEPSDKNWRIIGFSKHHWSRSPTISIEEAEKNPQSIEGSMVWDIDHGTTREWGGQYAGKLPRVRNPYVVTAKDMKKLRELI